MATPLGNSDTSLSTVSSAAELSRRPSVLLVADDMQVLRACAAKLEDAGISAAIARTGFAAQVRAPSRPRAASRNGHHPGGDVAELAASEPGAQ